MHSVFGEITVGLGDGKGAIQHVKRLDGVGDLHQLGCGIDAINNSFHCTNIVLSQTEVGRERDESLKRHIFLPKISGGACSREGISWLRLSQGTVVLQ